MTATEEKPTLYVIYRRVSTAEQGKSGLGLEAQDRDIDLYLTNYSATPYKVLGTFTDVLSGKSEDRPQLTLAMAMARKEKAVLIVSKLDRFSRDVEFIAKVLKDKHLSFRVASMPNADKFQLHIYAALAQQEREFISIRTVAALAVAKGKGTKLGGLRENTRMRNVEAQDAADAAAQQVASIILPMRKADASLAAIATALNAAKVPTRNGKTWYATTVKNALDRLTTV